MTEQQLQASIIKYLKDKAYIVKVMVASKNGIPDLLICYKGLFVGIELKLPTRLDTVTELQKYNIEEIERNKGIGMVISSLSEIKDLLSKIDKGLL